MYIYNDARPHRVFCRFITFSLVPLVSVAEVFSCDNSAMFYTVTEDNKTLAILQVHNETRAYELDAKSWDDWTPAIQHGKSCDFQIETRPSATKCVSTRDSNNDENAFCQGDVNDNVDVISEHEVLVACTAKDYAYAKVETGPHIHFMVAFSSEEAMHNSAEWDKASFVHTLEAFQAKLSCDDEEEGSSGVGSIVVSYWLIGLLALSGIVG